MSMQARERLTTALTIVDEFLRAATDLVAGTHVGTTHRQRLACYYWQLVVEDALAIALLVRHRRLQPARTLLRPQVESLIRGYWIVTLAEDSEIEVVATTSGRMPTKGAILKLFRQRGVEWMIGDERFPFDQLDNPFLKDALDSHTHRGGIAVGRIASSNQQGTDGVDDDELQILWMATGASRFAFRLILEPSGDDARLDAFDSLCKGLIPKLLALLVEEQPQLRPIQAG